MPGFDKEIAKLAQRILINPRKIDYHTGVLATKVTPGAKPSAMHLFCYRAICHNLRSAEVTSQRFKGTPVSSK